MEAILKELNRVAGVKGSMVVTKDGVVVAESLGPDLRKEVVAAVSSHMMQVSGRSLEDLGRGTLDRVALTSAHGRMVFVNLDVGYLVVITKMEMKLGQVLIEVESAARKIKQLHSRISGVTLVTPFGRDVTRAAPNQLSNR